MSNGQNPSDASDDGLDVVIMDSILDFEDPEPLLLHAFDALLYDMSAEDIELLTSFIEHVEDDVHRTEDPVGYVLSVLRSGAVPRARIGPGDVRGIAQGTVDAARVDTVTAEVLRVLGSRRKMHNELAYAASPRWVAWLRDAVLAPLPVELASAVIEDLSGHRCVVEQ